MQYLNRHVTKKHALDWYNIGIELGLELDVPIIDKDNPLQCETCFQRTLENWLKSTVNATWKMLEVALTNVNRAKLGLDPVTDVYGKDMCSYTTISVSSDHPSMCKACGKISKFLCKHFA